MADVTPTGMFKQLVSTILTVFDGTSLRVNAGIVTAGATATTNDILPGPKAYPVGTLTYDPIKLPLGGGAARIHIPHSIGTDDSIYGGAVRADGAGDRWQIWRSPDSLATVEYGQDLSTLTGADALLTNEYISTVTKTWAGYLVAVAGSNSNPTSGGVYFSTSFTTGFTRVLNTPLPLGKLPMCLYHGAGPLDSMYWLGEYSGVGAINSKLYASFDGGATWAVMDTLTPVDPNTTVNCHYHAVAYDPYSGRVYVSNGDGDNRTMKKTEDRGLTWDVVPDPIRKTWFAPDDARVGAHTNGWFQPTLMIPTDAGMVITPDNNLPASIQIMLRDKVTKVTPDAPNAGVNEIWDIAYLHTINLRQASHQQFSFQPYARRGQEIYFNSVRNSPSPQEVTIVGSGDGGRSWHDVGALRFPRASTLLLNEGLVGVDKNGYLYQYVGLGGAPFIARYKALSWQF